MPPHISENCKKKIKELEDELLYSISLGLAFPPKQIGLLAASFRSAGHAMDDECKKLMTDYENDILALETVPPIGKIHGLKRILDSMQSLSR